MFYPPRHIILALCIFANWDTTLLAHDWYDGECCHTDHCRAVDRAELEQLANGCFRYRYNGLVFCRDNSSFKPSKDAGYHVCFTSPAPYLNQTPKPLCLYLPEKCC